MTLETRRRLSVSTTMMALAAVAAMVPAHSLEGDAARPSAEQARAGDTRREPKRIVFRPIDDFVADKRSILMPMWDSPLDSEREVGTDTKDFPANLWADSVNCSAVYVGTNVMMTAAHCFRKDDATLIRGHLVWSVGVVLPVSGSPASGDCERPEQFKEGQTAPADWDFALCKMTDSPPVKFEVISDQASPIAVKTNVLLTGFGVDPASGITTAGKHLRTVKARVTAAHTTGTMRTCGSSLNSGDSGGGTYIYFDAQYKHRVQVAVNARKLPSACGSSEKESEMLGLWHAQEFIDRWHTEHTASICGIHIGAKSANCRNPPLPGTLLVQ